MVAGAVLTNSPTIEPGWRQATPAPHLAHPTTCVNRRLTLDKGSDPLETLGEPRPGGSRPAGNASRTSVASRATCPETGALPAWRTAWGATLSSACDTGQAGHAALTEHLSTSAEHRGDSWLAVCPRLWQATKWPNRFTFQLPRGLTYTTSMWDLPHLNPASAKSSRHAGAQSSR